MRLLAVACTVILIVGSAFFLARGHLHSEVQKTATGVAKPPDALPDESRHAKQEPDVRSRDLASATGPVAHALKDAEQREKMASGEAEFREIVARNIAFDYANFLSRLPLSPESRDLVLRALSDQFSAATAEEKRQYDDLLRQLLGDEGFAQLEKYRERLPLEKQIEAGVAALKNALPTTSADETAKVRQALESIPPVNPLAISVVQQAQISDADVQRVYASYEKLFDDAFAKTDVSASVRSALRVWYLSQQIAVQMNVLKTQQMILGSQRGG